MSTRAARERARRHRPPPTAKSKLAQALYAEPSSDQLMERIHQLTLQVANEQKNAEWLRQENGVLRQELDGVRAQLSNAQDAANRTSLRLAEMSAAYAQMSQSCLARTKNALETEVWKFDPDTATKADDDASAEIQEEHSRWQWMDDNGEWNDYDERNAQLLFSAVRDRVGGQLRLGIGGHLYVIDLGAMTQTNTGTGRVRRITFNTACCKRTRLTLPLWLARASVAGTDKVAGLQALDSQGDEFAHVSNEFLTSLVGGRHTAYHHNAVVTKIEKVCVLIPSYMEWSYHIDTQVHHTLQQARYESQRARMINRSEVALFHGTRDTPYTVPALEGLDARLASDSGYLGRAIYGSTRADYSHGFAHQLTSTTSTSGSRRSFVMLYCKFLVGSAYSATSAITSLVRPPLRTPLDRYDSVRLDSDGTTMYAVYSNDQTCVSYAIHYEL